MDCRTFIVLLCLFACSYAACIAQQPEDTVKGSGLIFDPSYYMAAKGFNYETAVYHWFYNGYYVGLQGNSFFNVNEYKQIYPELASYNNPAAHRHFVECGYYEGRVGLWSLYCGNNNGGCHPATTCTNQNAGRTCGPCPEGYSGDGSGSCPVDLYNQLLSSSIYNYDFYVGSANPDLSGISVEAAAIHWINHGINEGRQAVSSFNVNDYKRIYSDAASLSNRDAATQFINTWGRIGLWQWFCGNGNNGGCDSHVTCSNTFNSAPWCGMCPYESGLEGDGNTPGGCYSRAYFDYKVWNYNNYITINTDLAGMNEAQAKLHWRTTGLNEGRQANNEFSVADYKRIYSDIAPMSNFDAISHYINAGYSEKRVGIWAWWCGNGENGGCDSHVTCTNSFAGWKPSCGFCPAGFTGSGSVPGGCVPTTSSSGAAATISSPTSSSPTSASPSSSSSSSGTGTVTGVTSSSPSSSSSSSSSGSTNSALLHYTVYKYEFYVSAANPDLSGLSAADAQQHWITWGVDEGRQAIDSFNVNEYKQIYPDAASLSNRDAVVSFTTNWQRVGLWKWFCGNGNNGGCDTRVTCSNTFSGAPWCGMCPAGFYGTGNVPNGCWASALVSYKVYTSSFYKTKYGLSADLTYSQTEDHWRLTGIPEGRQGIATFAVNEYKQIYPDVAGLSNADAIIHYVNTGSVEKRAGTLSNWCGDGNNGGCDPVTTCTINVWGEKQCGWCPDGYRPGTGATPCIPN